MRNPNACSPSGFENICCATCVRNWTTGFPGRPVEGARALILGFTFKENCPDAWLKAGGVVYDVKHVLPREAVDGRL
jgi:hypothetical protein